MALRRISPVGGPRNAPRCATRTLHHDHYVVKKRLKLFYALLREMHTFLRFRSTLISRQVMFMEESTPSVADLGGGCSWGLLPPLHNENSA